MKNKLLRMGILFTSLSTMAQMGIGTSSPNATLDVNGEPTVASIPDGVMAPRLTGDQLAAKDSAYTALQTSILVYVTEEVAEVNKTDKTVNINKPGYYMFDGATWQYAFGGSPDEDITIGELVYYQTPPFAANFGSGDPNIGNTAFNWMSYHVNDLPILDNKIRLDGYFNARSDNTAGGTTFNPRLVNVSDAPVKIWFSALTTVDAFSTGNYLLAGNGGWVNLDNVIYYGYGANDVLGVSRPRTSGSPIGRQEVVQVDLSLENKWYRIYYFPLVDNMNSTNSSNYRRRIYISIQRLY